MRIRSACFIIMLLFSSCFGFAQLQVAVFTSVNLGCAKTVIAPNSTIDVGAFQVGTSGGGALCLINTGTSSITVTGITITGADFTLSAGTLLPLVLQPGAGSTTVAGFNFAPTAAGTRTAQITFADNASGSPQSFTLSGTGFTDFGLNMLDPGTNTGTVTAGQGFDYQLTVSGVPTFTGVVSFSCSNLPQGASCTFSPASGPLQSGINEFFEFNLNVRTTARPAASLHTPGFKVWSSLVAVFALVLGASRRSFKRIGLFLCFIVLAFAISCGGGSTKVPPGPTPPGTFTFAVNGSSNGVTHSKNMVLVVN
ncbi:hypothetical protein AYO50_00045 [Acidobacteria bacterium SCGC AG-212-P17]|nr:hypothetical protein AYO50_00045 [Acidobacteria bacterium SCGC AG-212-P17]